MKEIWGKVWAEICGKEDQQRTYTEPIERLNYGSKRCIAISRFKFWNTGSMPFSHWTIFGHFGLLQRIF